jgi:hypothetical protein
MKWKNMEEVHHHGKKLHDAETSLLFLRLMVSPLTGLGRFVRGRLLQASETPNA